MKATLANALFWVLIAAVAGFAATEALASEPGVADNSKTSSETEDCRSAYRDIAIGDTVADASYFSNIASRPGSLSAEIASLLTLSEKRSEAAEAPQDYCPEQCTAASKPSIVFTIVPKKFLETYDDSAHCAALLAKTTKTPIEVNARLYPSNDAFNKWFWDFSTGSGPDGEALYKKCDKSCSPQYSSTLHFRKPGVLVHTSVVCGHARDKTDNQYRLSAVQRWTCTRKPSTGSTSGDEDSDSSAARMFPN